jgi:hypothetical protein
VHFSSVNTQPVPFSLFPDLFIYSRDVIAFSLTRISSGVVASSGHSHLRYADEAPHVVGNCRLVQNWWVEPLPLLGGDISNPVLRNFDSAP